MPKQQRIVRMEQRGQMAAMQQLESKSDEELEAETKYRSAALAILGARASERFDAEKARGYFPLDKPLQFLNGICTILGLH